MAFSLSAKIGGAGGRGGTINADNDSGFRANTSDFDFTATPGDRGGTGDIEGANTGGPHSSSGFRRALMKTARQSSKLSGDIASRKDFGGKGFKKPNYFGQGSQRHGMHIGSGAPAIAPARDTGADFGGQ